MGIKQNFAQSLPKSLAKRQMELIRNPNQVIKTSNLANDIQRAAHLLQKTIAKINGAYAPSTIRAYRANFERFIFFCQDVSAPALPTDSETVAEYIQNLTKSGLKSASIRLAIASISTIHKLNQFSDPTQSPDAKLELRKAHRTLGRASKQAVGITAPILKKKIGTITNNLRGKRDRAILIVAYDSLCRRSELVSVKIEDIEQGFAGMPMRIKLRRSKTDQEGVGKKLAIKPNTQLAITHWMEAANISTGFLFRGIGNDGSISSSLNPGQINRIYKRLAIAASISEKGISGHSIRVGAAQDLVKSGISLPQLMALGRWSKPEMALRYGEGI